MSGVLINFIPELVLYLLTGLLVGLALAGVVAIWLLRNARQSAAELEHQLRSHSFELQITLDELAEIIEQIANYALENHLPDNEINQFIVNLELDKIYLDTRANKLSNQEMCGLLFRFPELSNIIIAHAFNVNLFWSDETVQAEVENLRETLDIEDWIKKASPVHTDVQHFLEISGLYAPMHKLEQ